MMSLADHLFTDMCTDIIENGFSTEGGKSAPRLGGRNFGIHHQTIWRGEQVRFVERVSGAHAAEDGIEECV